jgi:hypothetical protein
MSPIYIIKSLACNLPIYITRRISVWQKSRILFNLSNNSRDIRLKQFSLIIRYPLGGTFKTFIASEGIIHYMSVPGTPEQNSFIEYSGGVIITRTQKFQITAYLPHELWPWLVKTSVYQLNRTLTKHLG